MPIDRLDDLVSKSYSLAEELEARLNPILRTHEEKSGMVEEREDLVPLAQGLREIADRVEYIHGILASIGFRLEL